jgi:hypothetical protein
MSINQFLHKDNISTLWDVISDEDIFKFQKRDNQEKIYQMFVNNVKGFYDVEKTKTTNIVNVNKKYILLILDYIKKNFSQSMPNKIRISKEEPVKELITYEEIQNDRRSQFDRDYSRAQEEFTNSVTMKVPDVPNFSDNYKETPIKEMDKILKEMTAKRNYEVDQITKKNQPSELDANNWLKPQETSLKSEKFTPQTPQVNNNSSRLKYLNSDGELLPTKEQSKKSVSWNEKDNIEMIIDDEPDDNIFSKFKKVEAKTEVISNNSNSNSNELREVKEEIKLLHKKLDKIIQILNEK